MFYLNFQSQPRQQFVKLSHIEIAAGKVSVNRIHPIIEESYYILSGKSRIIVNDRKIYLTTSESIRIPPNAIHQIFNIDSDCVRAWTSNCLVLVN